MLWWFAQTTMVAAGLAVVALLAGRWRRVGPEARHALWLLVLMKLLMPPFVGWAWPSPILIPIRPVENRQTVVDLPGGRGFRDADPGVDIVPEVRIVEVPVPQVLSDAVDAPFATVEVLPELPLPVGPAEPEARRWWEPASPARMALSLWGLGTLVVVAWELTRIIGFGRTLRRSVPAPGWLEAEVASIAGRFGVRTPPARVVDGLPSPLLWCLGRPRLYLPAALVKSLPADRWRGVLAHEMAHLARRDHWVARLELGAEALWWWNPLFWAVRRRLRDEAERACDARVVRAWPDRRLTYAESLIDVCERLSRPAMPSPALGVGGGSGAARSLERRLSMILSDPIAPPAPFRAALALSLLAVLALPAWTLAQQDPPTPEPVPPPAVEARPAPDQARPAQAPRSADGPAPPARPIPPEILGVFGLDTLDEMSRVLADPEVIELGDQLQKARAKLDGYHGKLANLPNDPPPPAAPAVDPALEEAHRKLLSLSADYERLCQAKAQSLRELVPPALAFPSFPPAINGATEAQVVQEILRRFQADPEVVALEEQILEAQSKVGDARRVANKPDDPAVRRHRQEFEKLKARYDRLWATKSATIREQLTGPDFREAGFNSARLKARRDGKAAELRKAQALRDAAAAVARNLRLRLKGAQFVSSEELDRAEAEFRVADAEVDVKKAALEEAEVDLRRAISLPGGALTAADAARPVEDPALAEARGGPSPASLKFGRDGRAAELRKAEAIRDGAKAEVAYVVKLREQKSVGANEVALYEGKLRVAEAEVDARKAALEEAEEALRQATPRPGVGPAREEEAASPSKAPAGRSLADLRDAVEVAELQVDSKRKGLEYAEQAVAAAEKKKKERLNPPQGGLGEDPKSEIARLDDAIQDTTVRAERIRSELPGVELRLKQARQSVQAEEARVKREAKRVKSRLDWSEGMFVKGYVSAATYDADRDHYDDLMAQIDPAHKPTPRIEKP